MGSINAAYGSAQTRVAIRKAFLQNKQLPSIALGNFLSKEAFAEVLRTTASGWKKMSVPDQYQYDVLTKALPVQKELVAFAISISGKAPLHEASKRFSHRDYTLMHDHIIEKPGVIGLLFLTNWDTTAGGSVVFMQHGETLGQFAPQANTLLLVEKKKGVRSFVQYVNHLAGKKKLVMLST